MQSQLDVQGEELATLTVDKRKLMFENRSLKVEQQHLLAQIAAEKDKATTRSTRLTLSVFRIIPFFYSFVTIAYIYLFFKKFFLFPEQCSGAIQNQQMVKIILVSILVVLKAKCIRDELHIGRYLDPIRELIHSQFNVSIIASPFL